MGMQDLSSSLTQAAKLRGIEPDRGIFISLLVLIVWLPLPLASNRPWSSSLFELVTFSMGLWCFWLYFRGRLEISPALRNTRLPLLCLLIFSTVIFLQILPLPAALVSVLRPVNTMLEQDGFLTISIDPYASWVHLRLSIAFIVFAGIVLAIVNTRQRIRLLSVVIVVSGVFQGVYGSLMTLSGVEWGFFVPKQDYLGFATGTFINRNHLANYLVMCLATGTGLLLADLYQSSAESWREHGRRALQALLGNKFRLRIGLALMVIALVLTKSRMGNTSFFMSLLIAGFLWLLFTRRITKGSLLLLVSLIVIDTLIVGAWFGIEEVKERVETTTVATETRVEVNRDVMPLINDYLLFGAGAGTFYNAFTMYRQEDIVMTYDHAHNDYFQFLAEHGVIGCAPLIVLVLVSLFKSFRVMLTRKSLFFQAMAFAPLMAILAMLIHSVVEFNLQIPANAVLFIVLLVLPWVLRYVPSGRRRG